MTPDVSTLRHAESSEPLGLTVAQSLIWLGQKLHPDAPLYNMIYTFAFAGGLDEPAFLQAVRIVVNEHDALRTVIVEADGAPMQTVLPQSPVQVEVVDFSAHAEPEPAYQAWLDARRLRPFDLSASTCDMALIRLPGRHIWHVGLHHILTDAATMLILYRRVADTYARITGAADTPAGVAKPFGDYIREERTLRDSDAYCRDDDYWRNHTPDRVELFERKSRATARRDTRSERVLVDLGAERMRALHALAARPEFRAVGAHLALSNLLLTALAAYLRRASDQEIITIGLPFHNRPAAYKDTPGLFIEICPVSLNVAGDDSFASLHKRVAAEVLQAMRHVAPGMSSADRNRAYDVLLNYVATPFPPLAGMQPHVTWVHPGHGDSDHGLRIQVTDFTGAGAIQMLFDFNAGAFDASQREQAVQQFLRVLDAFLADPGRAIAEFSLANEAEWRAHVVAFNQTAAPYPADETAVSLFEAQAAQTPDAIAVECAGQRLTYRELNVRANQLAHHLIKRGAGDEHLVVIRMAHSVEVVVAILGALKAGCAYAPVDPAYPAERMAFMLRDICDAAPGATPILITQPYLLDDAPEDANIIALDAEFAAIAHEPADGINRARPRNLAYVIYTSGSTGQPKGVMIEHRSLTNYIWWAREQYSPGERLTWPLFSSLSFDLTVTSIFTPLITGGRIVAYPEAPTMRGMAILKVIEDNQADIVKLTPSHLAMLRDMDLRGSHIRKLIVGGEDFKADLATAITRAFSPHPIPAGEEIRIFNEYGPTEATVGCMIHCFDSAVDRALSVPIGRPAANAQIYVLDKHLNPTPTGVIGEMFIGGDGLARGYFNRPELTEERFVEIRDSRLALGQSPISNHQSLHLYKTGDLARWLPGGQLEFLGRADQQVKVGGARIELGEIEARLLAHPAIRECAVELMHSHTPAPAQAETRYCARCGLEANFPGVSYDAHGLCNFCLSYEGYKTQAQKYFKTLREFEPIVAQMKEARTPTPTLPPKGKAEGNKYDCVVLLSGGKDSAYMLYQLAGMGLRPLAFTLDNGYISDEAKANIRRMVSALGVDHVFGSTPAMNAIFVDSLKRHANVCNGCFKTIYTLATNLAREKGIRFIVTGLSRGQFFETRLNEDVFKQAGFDADKIDDAILAARKAYHRRDDLISRSLDVDVFRDDKTFEDVQFVDFYRYCTVSLDEMYAFLAAHAPWVRPSDTGRSTNCLINDAGIWVHKHKRGFHNYALPYAWDVRLGHKTREAALDELNDQIDEARVRRILREIGYDEPLGAPETPAARLVAYYVADAPIFAGELRAFLAQTLPDHMLPSYFIQMEHMPLTPNGKVDRKALPQPGAERPALASSFAEPATETERRIAQLWREMLQLERIGAHDNFFELGGTSLPALQMISRINRMFEIDLPVPSFFQNPTVSGLSAAIETMLITELEGMSEDEAERLLASA